MSSLKIHLKFVTVTVIYFAHIYFRRLPITLLPLIREEIELNSDDIGMLVSTHALFYTIGRLVFGVASDRCSKVALLLIGLVTCAISSVCIAFTQHYWQILVALVFLGVVQGAGWVPATLLVQSWYSKSTYGTMFSILACGSTFAGILQPFSKRFYWRDVELYTGIAMSIFAALSYFILRHENVAPKGCDEEQNDDSENSVWVILGSIVIWHIAFVYLFTMEMRTICETWVQLFLTDLQLSPDAFQITYEIGGLVGTMVSGIVIDLVTRCFHVDTTRRVIAVSYTCLMMCSTAAIFEQPEMSSIFGFLSGMFVNGSINVWCMIASQAGSPRIQGTVSAFISFVASAGSMLAGSPLAQLISNFGYKVFFYIFALQLFVVLLVSVFRIDLRMKRGKSSIDEDHFCPESNRNLVKKQYPFSNLITVYTVSRIQPIRDILSNKI